MEAFIPDAWDSPLADYGSADVRDAIGNVDYRPSSLEMADNPVSPVIKYRVIYFKYLDE